MAESKDNLKRQIAIKTTVANILNGNYVKEEGQVTNYFQTDQGKIFRLNIIGIVINKDTNSSVSSITIDDTTGQINVKAFEQIPGIANAMIGQIILLIGRPREFGGEKYIVPEIIKETNKDWFLLRKKELGITNEKTRVMIEPAKPIVQKENIKKEEPVQIKPSQVSEIKPNNHETIMQLINNMDEGKGVSIDEVIVTSKIKNAEEIIQQLIEEGEIFELRPGILKVL